MANGTDRRSRHFIIEGFTRTERYRSPPPPPQEPRVVPERIRARHGGALQEQLGVVRGEAGVAREAQQTAGMDEGLGLQIEFESFPSVELAFESLARERSGIELLNVRQDGNRTLATVFVPDGRLDHFERLIRDYLEEKQDSIGRPRDNRKLLDAIRRIRAGSFWWEVWLPVRTDRRATIASFRERAQTLGMRVAPGDLIFPERTVLLASASLGRCSTRC